MRRTSIFLICVSVAITASAFGWSKNEMAGQCAAIRAVEGRKSDAMVALNMATNKGEAQLAFRNLLQLMKQDSKTAARRGVAACHSIGLGF